MSLRTNIVIKAPFNSLSFGQVSFNLLRTIYELDGDKIAAILPIGNNFDFTAFRVNEAFFAWFKEKCASPFSRISRDMTTLQLWHINGSWDKPTDRSILYTFHELDSATVSEKMVCSLHDKVLFSSKFSSDIFAMSNCSNVPLGFDRDVVKLDKKYFGDDVIHFGLIGKWESRKNTSKIIKTWVSLFGNNKKYRLTCLVENPFLKPEQYQALIRDALGGKEYFNITFLPRLKTNAEVLELYNSIDIDLSGLSSAEGWNLPAFDCTCLGKWSCVAAHTSHLDWATETNSIIVHPPSKRPAFDGVFFAKSGDFNIGNVYNIDEADIERTMLKSVGFAKKPNPEGEALGKSLTYERMWNSIKEQIS